MVVQRWDITDEWDMPKDSGHEYSKQKEVKGNRRCLENRERRLKGGPEFAFWEEWEAKPQSSFKEVDMIKFAF